MDDSHAKSFSGKYFMHRDFLQFSRLKIVYLYCFYLDIVNLDFFPKPGVLQGNFCYWVSEGIGGLLLIKMKIFENMKLFFIYLKTCLTKLLLFDF